MTDGAHQGRSRVVVVFAVGAFLTSAVWAAQVAGLDAQPSPLPAAAATGIHKIKHIIVIMQENRSFDEYFGTYPGADGIAMQDGVPTVCIPDPKSRRCARPFHTSADVNHGGPHTSKAAEEDIDGGKMDGFLESVNSGNLPPCQYFTQPNCLLAQVSPDVLGYHDRREIPNYWTYADNFVLQDHMFEPSTSWSLPAHLFMVSAWSAVCDSPDDPASCMDVGDGGPGIRAARGRPYRQEYIWTDLTYLLHKQHVSWAYYLSEGYEPDCEDDAAECSPTPQLLSVPSMWNPLPAFQTV
ncbi:MAG TPA: alkaline phosphatase family protein, partial [Gammaproteobacteria bacterium]